jgi:hypothetical protein
MDARELRLENKLLRPNGNIAKVTWGVIKDIENGDITYAPVKLTQDWMLKNGVKDENGDPFIYCSKEDDLRYYLSDFGFIHLIRGGSCPLWNYEHIIYVHLFQGLYFYETGKELEVK